MCRTTWSPCTHLLSNTNLPSQCQDHSSLAQPHTSHRDRGTKQPRGVRGKQRQPCTCVLQPPPARLRTTLLFQLPPAQRVACLGWHPAAAAAAACACVRITLSALLPSPPAQPQPPASCAPPGCWGVKTCGDNRGAGAHTQTNTSQPKERLTSCALLQLLQSTPPTALQLLVSQTTAGAAAAAPERASRCRYEAPLGLVCPSAALPCTAPLTHSPFRQFAPGVGGLPVVQQHLDTRVGTVQRVPHVVVYQHVSTDAPGCQKRAATATGRARPCQSARPTNSSAAARCGALPSRAKL